MLFTLQDQLAHLGKRIKARRLALDLTQQAAAAYAGMAHRTWRRMETESRVSIEDRVRAAIALRCDEGFAALFSEMAAARFGDKSVKLAPGTPLAVGRCIKRLECKGTRVWLTFVSRGQANYTLQERKEPTRHGRSELEIRA